MLGWGPGPSSLIGNSAWRRKKQRRNRPANDFCSLMTIQRSSKRSDTHSKPKALRILIARDGNQGLALAEREDPDLVILDMMMPKRSGFLVLEKLRRTRPVPVRNYHDHGQ